MKESEFAGTLGLNKKISECSDVVLIHQSVTGMSDNLVEKIFQYIRMVNQVSNINLFFALNLKQYLTEDQLKELYKLVQYSKIQLVLIEFDVCGRKLDGEEVYILDKDDCIITY